MAGNGNNQYTHGNATSSTDHINAFSSPHDGGISRLEAHLNGSLRQGGHSHSMTQGEQDAVSHFGRMSDAHFRSHMNPSKDPWLKGKPLYIKAHTEAVVDYAKLVAQIPLEESSEYRMTEERLCWGRPCGQGGALGDQHHLSGQRNASTGQEHGNHATIQHGTSELHLSFAPSLGGWHAHSTSSYGNYSGIVPSKGTVAGLDMSQWKSTNPTGELGRSRYMTAPAHIQQQLNTWHVEKFGQAPTQETFGKPGPLANPHNGPWTPTSRGGLGKGVASHSGHSAHYHDAQGNARFAVANMMGGHLKPHAH